MRNKQQVEVFSQSFDERGRGNFDAGERLAKWVEENPHMRVVSIAGDGYQIIAVVEPCGAAPSTDSICPACPLASRL